MMYEHQKLPISVMMILTIKVKIIVRRR